MFRGVLQERLHISACACAGTSAVPLLSLTSPTHTQVCPSVSNQRRRAAGEVKAGHERARARLWPWCAALGSLGAWFVFQCSLF